MENELVLQSQQFEEIALLIQRAKDNVLKVANTALIELYWNVGKYISDKINASEWGDGVVKQLAAYIAKNFPDIKGFSDKNLWRMKQFYETYPEKLSPLVRELSWTNNLIIMNRTKTNEEREFYLTVCIKERLSKRELERHIDTALYERSLSEPKLSAVMREIAPNAEKIFKDHYVLEFLGGKEYPHENSLRKALCLEIQALSAR